MFSKFIIEIENQRAWNWQKCHCTRFEQDRCTNMQIPIGIAVRSWGTILLTRNLMKRRAIWHHDLEINLYMIMLDMKAE